VIAAAYRPSEDEVAKAKEILSVAGAGATALPDGTFVDDAVVRQANEIIAMAR
jgi:citrate lyase subunit beta/citryl-CoA lyase